MKVHFIGINGSGITGVACMAKQKGFDVSGCDINGEGAYSEQLKNLDIKVETGHNPEHITNDLDLVVISPAVLYKDKFKEIPEIVKAFAIKKTIKWQKFLGDYIMKRENIIAVSGTHGKTTTTTLISLLLEKANLDPNCVVGGIVKEWNQTYRLGNSNWHIVEADEYDGNFLNYFPKYIILNNLEMEHPECFKNFEDYKKNFINFLKNIQQNGIIVFNYDDVNSLELLKTNVELFKDKNIKIIGYTFKENNPDNFCELHYIKTDKISTFELDNHQFILKKLFGEHNIKNAVISTILAKELKISNENIQDILENFTGSTRRLDCIFKNNQIKIYDDYAHHHTQVKVTINALKNKVEKNEKIIAILEPHLISRFEQNSEDYLSFLELADYPIMTKFFKSRESFRDDLNITPYLVNRKTKYIAENTAIIEEVQNIINANKQYKYTILVMGAGNSYKLANDLKVHFEDGK